MLDDGMRNASTRNVRSTNQTRSATTIDFDHSQSQRRIDHSSSGEFITGVPVAAIITWPRTRQRPLV